MKRLNSLLLVVVFAFVYANAFAWGQKGHDIIAYIAEQHLTDKAKTNIEKILDGKSIVYYSSWMDNLRSSPDWTMGYQSTSTWHYINIDEDQTLETMERNVNGDILTALDLIIDSLSHYKTLNDSLQRDYLKMIVHLVGDLHCPMHVGRLSDRGGNNVLVKWFNSKSNLHSVWDTRIVDGVHAWSYSEWQYNLDRCSEEQIAEYTKGTTTDWLLETHAITKKIYEESIPNENLSYKYIYIFREDVEQQLLKAGYRLAYLLNKLFG